MSRQHHFLKTETKYYQLSKLGYKNFEIRKNDRDFRVGDIVNLQEVVEGIPTGRQLLGKEITYIFYGGQYGLDKDYCVFILK